MVDYVSIINTMRQRVLYLRTIDQLWIDHSTIAVGSNSVTARCRVMGRDGEWLVKCYVRKRRNLKAIYKDAYYERELGIFSIMGTIEYADIVLLPWVEGTPLDRLLGSTTTDYSALSRAFDSMALSLLDSEYAHGDVKPENIIVRADGSMQLIDFDGAWLPSMKSCEADEIGTDGYRHPHREKGYLHKAIDDYPICVVSLMLATLAADRETFAPMLNSDMTLFNPRLAIARKDRVLLRAADMFLERRDVARYRMARDMQDIFVVISNLRDYLRFAHAKTVEAIPLGAEAVKHRNMWGYKLNDEWIVPPLYSYISDVSPRYSHAMLRFFEHVIEIPITG